MIVGKIYGTDYFYSLRKQPSMGSAVVTRELSPQQFMVLEIIRPTLDKYIWLKILTTAGLVGYTAWTGTEIAELQLLSE
jgi:hypothetical protein